MCNLWEMMNKMNIDTQFQCIIHAISYYMRLISIFVYMAFSKYARNIKQYNIFFFGQIKFL